jgi:hypothetical protein
VGVPTLPTEPVYTTCRCSMRVRVRRAHARRASPCKQNRTNGASSTPLGPVWEYPRYPLSPYIQPVDAACVHECEGPTHDGRRRASKSHEWCLSDATRACVGVPTLPTEPVYTTCRCSMRVRVRRAHARRASPCKQNRTNGATATPLGPVWEYPRYPLSLYIPSVDAACMHECGGPTHDERRRASKSHQIGWRFFDAAVARVGVRTLPTEPVYTTCRCSMRARVRRAHARRAAPCKQIARMVP